MSENCDTWSAASSPKPFYKRRNKLYKENPDDRKPWTFFDHAEKKLNLNKSFRASFPSLDSYPLVESSEDELECAGDRRGKSDHTPCPQQQPTQQPIIKRKLNFAHPINISIPPSSKLSSQDVDMIVQGFFKHPETRKIFESFYKKYNVSESVTITETSLETICKKINASLEKSLNGLLISRGGIHLNQIVNKLDNKNSGLDQNLKINLPTDHSLISQNFDQELINISDNVKSFKLDVQEEELFNEIMNKSGVNPTCETDSSVSICDDYLQEILSIKSENFCNSELRKIDKLPLENNHLHKEEKQIETKIIDTQLEDCVISENNLTLPERVADDITFDIRVTTMIESEQSPYDKWKVNHGLRSYDWLEPECDPRIHSQVRQKLQQRSRELDAYLISLRAEANSERPVSMSYSLPWLSNRF